MALTSASTIQDALDQYNNNLSWDGDITKAANALEAVRYLLANRAQSSTFDGMSLNYPALEMVKEELSAYVSTQSATAKANRRTFTRIGAVLH
jgi:hypothetical protein